MAPSLDVSDAFDQSFIDDVVQVTRIAVAVDPLTGRAIKTPTVIPSVPCVVTSVDGDSLLRLPEATRSEGAMMFHALGFVFSEGSPTTDADEILWQGKTYVVKVVNDYSRYGAGYTSAIGALQDLR